jgi:putative aminopeptidase FrvX
MSQTQVFPALLDELLRTPGPSGREGPVADVVIKSLPEGVEVSRDGNGSLLMRVPGRTTSRPRLAIFGHMDEVGLMITGFDDDGGLVFGAVGSLMPEVLVAQRIKVLTEHGELPGVIGAEPNWYPGRDASTPVPPTIPAMRIDIGAGSPEEAAALVQIGDVAVIDVEPVRLAHGHVTSRSFDDRFGVYVAAEVVRRLAAVGGAPTDVVGIGTVQEETTFAGAYTSPNVAEPDVAVAVDVDYARAVPREDGWSPDGLGSGVVILRGTVVNDELAQRLISIATTEQIPHIVRAYAGPTATDADAVTLTRTGTPAAVLSIPLRNMHSPVEVAQLDDIEACVQLIVAFAKTLA